jgi:ABC-type antimicrobial peptide transport system ATPase subunit
VSFAEAYVDIRQFGPSDWDKHRSLAVALIKADKEALIADSAAASLRATMRSALDGLTGSNH